MTQTSPSTIDPTNSWAVRMADRILRNYPSEHWKWHYEHALVIKAIAAVGAECGGVESGGTESGGPGEARFQGVDQAWVDHFVSETGEIRTYRFDEFNLDQINPGKLLFPLYQRTADPRYLSALRRLRSQLQSQPRTPSGGFWHKQIYPNQMWLDGLYMAGPFYAEYAATFDEPAIFDDLTHQFILLEQHARDPQTGLLYHAWDETKTQKWANPETGCSPHFWGRAIGWFVMALVDTLDFLPTAHAHYSTLVEMLNRLSGALLRWQDPASGLWYQVVDQPNRPGNYLESSVSAMLAYGWAKAVRRGLLPAEFGAAAQRAFHGLLDNQIHLDAAGSPALGGICSVAGLGGNPYRDGTYEYYVKEPVAVNDFKGVGPFILAALELEKH